MSEGRSAQPWMTRGLALGLVLVSALSLLAFLVLNAFAPELRGDQTGSANVLSKSAVGFAGLKILLDTSGEPSLIDRGEGHAANDSHSLTILTPEPFTASAELARTARAGGTRLIVLPKWIVLPDPAHQGWALKIDAMNTTELETLFADLSKSTKIARRAKRENASLSWSDPDFAELWPHKQPLATDQLQTIAGKDWRPVLVDEKGKMILAQFQGKEIYVLADPDFLSTQGLHDRQIARLAMLIVDDLRANDRPVVFDVTLNGFRATPDLMREALSPPFLGATLCALLAAAFLGFRAFSRFGTPVRQGRAIAFGKRALADSTAGLIRMLGREPHMGMRYAFTLRNLVLRYLGAPRETEAADQWLARAQNRVAGPNFGVLFEDARSAQNVSALMRAAEGLYRWKRGIMNERG